MNERKERFYMSLFIVSYIGIHLAMFFWEAAGISFICRRMEFSFRAGVIILTLVRLVFYFFRNGIITPVDGITVSGIAAAGLSAAIMGNGSGEWVLKPEFLIDLGVLTVSLFLVMLAVFFHERGELERIESLEAEIENAERNASAKDPLDAGQNGDGQKEPEWTDEEKEEISRDIREISEDLMENGVTIRDPETGSVPGPAASEHQEKSGDPAEILITEDPDLRR